MISRLLKKTATLCAFSSLRAFSAQPWKKMDHYYNYDFNTDMEFLDNTKRYPLFRVMDLEGKVLNPKYETLDKEFLLGAMESMVISREMDNVYNNAQRQNRITFYMTGTYEEGANVGAISAIKPTDALFYQYREFPMMLRRGLTPLMYLNHLKGNKDDKVLGKCLALANAVPELNIFPGSAPLGNRNPHASGAGYYFRVKGIDRIAFVAFGDGAASEGDVHASMNFAATLGSQTMFFCRNNAYAISTFREEQYAGDGIAPRAIGYGMPAIKVDGSDIFAVYHAVKRAREMIMARKGPALVEVYTYRGGDHSTSDSAGSYRNRPGMDEVNKYFQSIGDPIIRLGKYMQGKGYLKDYASHVKQIGDKTRAECLGHLRKLDEVKFADFNLMFDDVYKDMPWNVKEQKKELHAHLKKYSEAYPINDFAS